MNRRDLVLAILAAADGQSYSPVQIQKAAFLVTRNVPEVVSEGDPFHFVAYDYGPFDRAVYSEAEMLQIQGHAQVNQSSGRWRTYSTSPVGLSRGREILESLPQPQREYITRVSSWVRSLDFATLVKSIYEAYPDTKANSIFQG
jgi:hypothetical protein